MGRMLVGSALQRVAKNSPALATTLWNIDVALMRAILGLTAHLSVDQASALGDRLGRLYGPRLRRHRHLLNNLKVAFPDRDDVWIERTAVAAWGQMGRVGAEYPHLPELARSGQDQRVEVIPHFDLGPVRRGERPMIFAAAHLANWNLPAVGGGLTGVPLSVLFSAHRGDLVVERWRKAMPSGFIEAAQAPRQILAELNRGHSVGLHMDQRVDGGEPLPFFGIEALTTTVPARLAGRVGVPLVPVRVERLEGARFRMTLYEPVEADPEIDDPRERARRMTAQVLARFEQWIRERPDQWASAKRRWPKPEVAQVLAERRQRFGAEARLAS